MEKKRIPFWDNIKGLLIILVVFGHFIYGIEGSAVNFLNTLIYSFHMPAFVFVSGYFSSSENSTKLEKQLPLIRAAVYLTLAFLAHELFIGNFEFTLAPLYVTWYLIALVVWRLSSKFLPKSRAFIVLTFVAGLLIGFIPGIDNTFAVSRIIALLPFFMAGLYVSKNFKSPSINGKKLKLYGAILLIAGVTLLTSFLMASDIPLNQRLFFPYENVFEVAERLIIYIVACIFLIGILAVTSQKEIKFITKAGRNSLSVFLLHRFFALGFTGLIKKYDLNEFVIIAISVILSLITVFILSTDTVSKCVTKILDVEFFKKSNNITALLTKSVCGLLIISFALISLSNYIIPFFTNEPEIDAPNRTLPGVLSSTQVSEYENSFKILFTGDLILLEDQVRNAYDGSSYDFSDMFEYTTSYISDADLAIGILEGPLGGEEIGFTTSNYADGKSLYLNFPDEFAVAIKDAGFDVVSLSNNHLCDKGIDAALRTQDVLDSIGLNYVGAYRSSEDKANNNVEIIEQDGIRIAILSYTYGFNYYTEDDLFGGEVSYLSSFLTAPDSRIFENVKAGVVEDFNKAKSLSPDLILVLPHWGTQFTSEADVYQTVWHDIFVENGADIILGDHTHSVQPVMIEQYNNHNVATLYCPGNYSNVFREFNGDASAMVEIYVDRDSLEVTGGAVIPMWTSSPINGNYRPLPIYSIMTDANLQSRLTTDDLERADEVCEIISNDMLGIDIPSYAIEDRWFFNETGYVRQPVEALNIYDSEGNILDEYDNSFYELLKSSNDICFIGDSITCGSNNRGYPWYEPLVPYISGNAYQLAVGGYTSRQANQLVKDSKNQPCMNSDLFVIAVGTNDIRYRNDDCAMNSSDYINELNDMVSEIKSVSPDAKLVFIAPWISYENDPFKAVSYSEVLSLHEEYEDALKTYCDSNDFCYINANSYIDSVVSRYPQTDYLVDHIHPNPMRGIYLYCEAVLSQP